MNAVMWKPSSSKRWSSITSGDSQGWEMNLSCLLPAGGMPASACRSGANSSPKASNKCLPTDSLKDSLKTGSNQSLLGSQSMFLGCGSFQTVCTSCCLNLFPLQKKKKANKKGPETFTCIVLVSFVYPILDIFVVKQSEDLFLKM